ncbi:unnamed protein product [Heterobilharzia americana]|nr:unnamed protein product [Heterobilharzia americana]
MKVKNKRPYNRSETCTRSSSSSTSGGTNNNSTPFLPEKITEQLDNLDSSYTITNNPSSSNNRKRSCDPTPKSTKTRHKSNKHTNPSSTNSTTNNSIGSSMSHASGSTSLKITHRVGRAHLSSVNTNVNNVNNNNNHTNSKSSCCSSNNCSSSSTSSILSGGTSEPVDPYEFAVKSDETNSQCGLNESLLPIKRLKLERNDDRCLITDSARSSPMLHTTSNRLENSFNHSSPGANSSPLVQSCTRPLSVFTDFSYSNNTTNNNSSNGSSGITRNKPDITENCNNNNTRTPMTVTTVPSTSPHHYHSITEMNSNLLLTANTKSLLHTGQKLPDSRAETPPTVPAYDSSSGATLTAATATPNTTPGGTVSDNNDIAHNNAYSRSFPFNSASSNFEKPYRSEAPQFWITTTSPLLSTATNTPTTAGMLAAPTSYSSLLVSSQPMSSCLSSSPPFTSDATSVASVAAAPIPPLQSSSVISIAPTLSSVPSSQYCTSSFNACPPVKPERRCTGVNTLLDNCKATLTEPDLLGPCEPGTTICLNGIVWLETTTGVLVVNVTWRGRTYIGTLLDATQHDFAPPCPRDYVPPFKSSIRSSNRTKRRTGVGSNYKSNLGSHMAECSWKSGSSSSSAVARHRLRGRASNSLAVMPETISTTRPNTQQQMINLTKTDTSKETTGDSVSGDTDLIQCLPQRSDEEISRNSNRNTKLHKSRKLFRGSSTSSSDCPSEVLPDLEKSSELGDVPCKSGSTSDQVMMDSQRPDHSRPQTPLCSNSANNSCNNNSNPQYSEENSTSDELHDTFPICCPIDGCKKRFSHVLALRFHLNHTPHDNLPGGNKKRASNVDSNQDFDNCIQKNCDSIQMKSPPSISPLCPSSPGSPVAHTITSSSDNKQSLQPSLNNESLAHPTPQSQPQQPEQQSRQYDEHHHDSHSNPRYHRQCEYEQERTSIQPSNMFNHNYKLLDDTNEHKFMDTNLPRDLTTGINNNDNSNNDNNNNGNNTNKSLGHSISGQISEINKYPSSKKRLSTSVLCTNNPFMNEINSTGSNVRTVTAHTVSVPHGSLECGNNSNLRPNNNSTNNNNNNNSNNNNQSSFSSKRSLSSNPRDLSKHKSSHQSSSKSSNQNTKTDSTMTMMMMPTTNYSRYSGLPGSRVHEHNNSKEVNDSMSLPMCHVAPNIASSSSPRFKSSTAISEANYTISNELSRGLCGNSNNSSAGSNLMPNLQNAWNFQIPSTHSMPLPSSIKDYDQKSTGNSLANGGSSHLPTYSNSCNFTSTNEAINHRELSAPQLIDSKHFIPTGHLPGTSITTSTNQIMDPNSIYYGIPDFLVAALSTLTSSASSPYSCIPEAFRSYMHQQHSSTLSMNSPLVNFSRATDNNNTTTNNSPMINIPKAHNSSTTLNTSIPSNSSSSPCTPLLDGVNNPRFFNPQLFQNLGSNLPVRNFASPNMPLLPERLDPLKLSAAYLMQYTNPGTQLSSSSSTFGGSQFP